MSDLIRREDVLEIMPHGRLVDADALVEMAYKEETDGVTFCVDSAEELEILFDDNAPTVIEAEGE